MADEKTPDSAQATAATTGFGALRLMANWVIAAVSLAVIGGFMYWAVAVGTRDPHEVPIIRAMEGPSRVQPDNPGGRKASHQGLAVNAVQSDGTVEEPAREVVLAPAPQQLSDDDGTLGSNEVAAVETEPQAAVDVASVGAETPAERSEEELDALEIADSVAEAVAERELSNSDPDLIPRDNVSGTQFSPRRSLRPKGRPGGLRTEITRVERTVAATQTSRTDAETATEEIAATADAPVAIGTRLIQLGAYDTAELARSEWNKLLIKHTDLLEEKTRLVVEAESGGRKFYRLRAVGFNSLDDSRALCAALLARGTPCIPVTAR